MTPAAAAADAGDALRALAVAAVGEVGAEAVVVGVRVGHATAFASRSRPGHARVDEQTVMYAASVTKQVLGLLVARAVEAGLLDPDDALADRLPGMPGWADGIRLRHLLHHISGLPDVTAPELGVAADNAEVLRRLSRVPESAVAPPGRAFGYANVGYVLLAEVLRRAYGVPVEVLADEHVFAPLGLGATRLGAGGPGARAHPGPGPRPPGTVGDGGLWTTARDLLAWLGALDDGRFEPAAVRRFEQPGRLDDQTPLDYAWGVRVTRSAAGRRLTHGGTWRPWLAKTVRLPEVGVAVVVLAVGGTEAEISELGTVLADRVAEVPGVAAHVRAAPVADRPPSGRPPR